MAASWSNQQPGAGSSRTQVKMAAKANFDSRSDEARSLAEAEGLLRELAGPDFAPSPVPEQVLSALLQAKPSTALERPDAQIRYQALVEQIPAVIFTAFLNEGISEAYVSPHIETVLGFTQQEWLNDPVRWYHHIHPGDRERWNIEAAQLVLSAKPLRSVYRVLARDGHVVWMHCEVKLILTEDGRPWFVHGTAFDITEFKLAEQALKDAQAELEERVQSRTAELAAANAELKLEISNRIRAQSDLALKADELARSNADLEQFAYSASHDLQEPLRNIALYSQWLRTRYEGKLDPGADHLIGIITEGAQRMAMMVRDLLAYTQIGSEEEPVQLVDTTLVLEEIRQDLRVPIMENQATITQTSLPGVRMQKVHVRQLFQNLISNALKYRSDALPRIHISASEADGICTFSVQDNGIGIEPEYREKIFGIFRRLHGRENYSGTGIGLAICKRIVERYGGRIWVESPQRKGVAFLFTLPAEKG